MALYPSRLPDPLDQVIDNFFGGGRAMGSGLMRAPETVVMETEREIRVFTAMPARQSW